MWRANSRLKQCPRPRLAQCPHVHSNVDTHVLHSRLLLQLTVLWLTHELEKIGKQIFNSLREENMHTHNTYISAECSTCIRYFYFLELKRKKGKKIHRCITIKFTWPFISLSHILYYQQQFQFLKDFFENFLVSSDEFVSFRFQLDSMKFHNYTWWCAFTIQRERDSLILHNERRELWNLLLLLFVAIFMKFKKFLCVCYRQAGISSKF